MDADRGLGEYEYPVYKVHGTQTNMLIVGAVSNGRKFKLKFKSILLTHRFSAVNCSLVPKQIHRTLEHLTLKGYFQFIKALVVFSQVWTSFLSVLITL